MYPTATNPHHECVPQCVPSVSHTPSRAHVKRVCPRSPLPTGGHTRRTPHPPCPTTMSQPRPNHPQNHQDNRP